MNIIEAIEKRRCTRSFKKEKIPLDQIQELLSIATLAPSAGNLQSWHFVVVENEETKHLLVKASLGQSFLAEASIVIVGCANEKRSSTKYGKRGKELYAIQDITLALHTLWLAAIERGFVASWVGAFDEKEIQEILDLPPYLRPVALLPLGFADEKPSRSPRLELEKVSTFIS